jgi:phosphate transport system substrate-binding protein
MQTHSLNAHDRETGLMTSSEELPARTAKLRDRARCRARARARSRARSSPALVPLVAAAVAAGFGGLSACAGDAEGGGRGAGTLTGAGATFAMPLITVWSSEYQREVGARVNYNSIGSGGGIRAHTDRTVDFAASEAPLTPEQFEAAPGTLTIPFTIGTVTLAYNLPGVAELRLTGEVLAGIYLGEITRWSDPRIAELNPVATLPDQGIVVVHRSDGSGTTYVFTDYLSKVSPRWADEVGFSTSVAWPLGIGGNGNEGVAGAIRNNPSSIGYIELSYANSLGMPTAFLRNREGRFVRPSLEGGTAAAAASVDALPEGDESWHAVSFTDAPGADSYPISSFSYYFVYEDLGRLARMTPERAEAIVRWLEWTVTEGQRHNVDVSNASIPESVRALNLRTLERVRFEGRQVKTW